MRRILIGLIALLWSTAAPACPGAEAPCTAAGGDYYAVLPNGVEAPPVMVFLHGYRGDAAAIARASGFVDGFLERGYAVIVPQGLRLGPGRGTNWAVRDGRDHPRDDVAFLGGLLDDAAARFDLDRARVLLTGFSRGGSMVWDIACAAPGTAAAYASIAGGFWRPLPDGCAGPARLLHIHGFTDTTVPLEGRVLRGGPVAQGDIYAGLHLWRQTNGCGDRAGAHDTSGAFWRKTWTDCAGGALTFALHPGAHGLPKGWVDLAMGWFEAE